MTKTRKKPSYTALLKEVRRLRKDLRRATVSRDSAELEEVSVSDLTAARIEVARKFGANLFALRRNWLKTERDYRLIAITQEDVYVD